MMKIEIDGRHNECLDFRPLQRRIRGRFDYLRDSEPQSKMHDDPPIPGQRIGFENGVGFVEESLHDDEHTVVRERLENKGFRIPPKREEFEADESTWCFWMAKAVDSGVAKLVSGKVPKIDESKVRMNFITAEQPSATDKLTAALERQSDMFEKLLTKLAG